ncbi:hypothetical protein HY633_01310 [Candidatus Uhrbacteria bacterium]|nr:hypothetical protein [Candidatus Uhrbacteria bacterium]
MPPAGRSFTDTTSTFPPGSNDPVGYSDAEKAAPAADPYVSGSYSAGGAEAATPTIDVDKRILPPPPDKKLPCVGGSLIKSSDDRAVYYCGKDGRRYVFPNPHVYSSWFSDFTGVKVITPEEMAKVPIGGNVAYKPGVRMVKIQTDPKVYAIARDGNLRWVKSEASAKRLYGADWNKMIDDVPDAFFFNYKIGEAIE